MIALVAVLVILIGRVAFSHDWPGTARLAQWWRSYRPTLVAFVRAAPATFIYLAMLSVTTWVLVGTSPTMVSALLEEQSTNLHHLRQDPLRVLIRSAFWLSGYELLFWAALFLIVLAPAERWLGTVRWLVAFAAGLIVYAAGGIVIDRDFTAYGHAAALVIGFALYPLTRAPAVRARATQPLLRMAPADSF